jgi:CRP-like cAMP-binding protein
MALQHRRVGGLDDVVAPALLRLQKLGPLPESDREALRRAGTYSETAPAGAELQQEGRCGCPRILISGFACRQRVLADGRRQIFDFLIPGDLIGAAPDRPLAQEAVAALTTVETAPAPVLRDCAVDPMRFPGLSAAVARCARQEQLRLLDHVVRLGRQTGYERTAHLLLELGDRLAAAGLGDGRRFPMPLTQESLADSLGLSVVHVNRILQQLRRERLIELRSGEAVLIERELLAGIADYRSCVAGEAA